jgi:hypothetical protein
MFEIPKVIRVERAGNSFVLTIDGEEFPYPIAWEPISAVVDPDGSPTLTITLMAEQVEVVNHLHKGAPADV